jgi:hypothetical protein
MKVAFCIGRSTFSLFCKMTVMFPVVLLYVADNISKFAPVHCWRICVWLDIGRLLLTKPEAQYASTPAIVIVMAISKTTATKGDMPFI